MEDKMAAGAFGFGSSDLFSVRFPRLYTKLASVVRPPHIRYFKYPYYGVCYRVVCQP